MTDKKNISVDDVLNEFVLENEFPSQKSLKNFVSKYPNYEKELIEFSTAWLIQESLPSEAEISLDQEEEILVNTMKYAEQILEQQGIDINSNSEVISNLAVEIKKRGLTIKKFAEKCNLNISIVTKLNERLILFGSIPKSLIQKISDILECSIESIVYFLSSSPSQVSNASFISNKKPELLNQELFIEAINSSALSTEEKMFWLSEIDPCKDSK